MIGCRDDQSVSIGDPVVFEREVDTLSGPLFVRTSGLPDPLRVIVEVVLPRRFTVGRQIHRARAFGWSHGHQRPLGGFEGFARRYALGVERCLVLDRRHREVVAQAIAAFSTPGGRRVLAAVRAHPGIRNTTLAGDPRPHGVGFQPRRVVLPRGCYSPGFPEFHPHFIVARIPVLGPVGHVPRRSPSPTALGCRTARLDVCRVVITEVFKDQFVGAAGTEANRVDVLHCAVDGPTGLVPELGTVG